MPLSYVGKHLIEHFMGLGVVGHVLKLGDLSEALAVLGDDVLASRLTEQLLGQLLDKKKTKQELEAAAVIVKKMFKVEDWLHYILHSMHRTANYL